MMRVGVIGAGALSTFYGSRLQAAGNEVHLVAAPMRSTANNTVLSVIRHWERCAFPPHIHAKVQDAPPATS